MERNALVKRTLAEVQYNDISEVLVSRRHWEPCMHPEETSCLGGLLRKRRVPGNGVKSVP